MKHVYIHLFHGRTSPDQELEDWGRDGPLLGPFAWAHMTYASDIKCGDPEDGGDSILELAILGEMVYYDGIYYGDCSTYADLELDGKITPTHGDQWLARPPGYKIGAGKIVLEKQVLECGTADDDERRGFAIVIHGPESQMSQFAADMIRRETGERVKLEQNGWTWGFETAAGLWEYHDGIRVRDDAKGWLDV